MQAVIKTLKSTGLFVSRSAAAASASLWKQLTTPSTGQNFCQGILIGIALVIWLQQIILSWGISSPVFVALIVCSIVGASVALFAKSFFKFNSESSRAIIIFLMAAAVMGQGPAISFGRNLLDALPNGLLLSSFSATACMTFVLIAIWSIPVAIATLLFTHDTKNTSTSFFGIATSLLFTISFLSPLMGMSNLVLGTTLFSLGLAAVGWWLNSDVEEKETTHSTSPRMNINPFDGIFVLLIGVLAGLLPRYVAQLMPTANFVAFAEIAGVFVGLGISQSNWFRKFKISRSTLCLSLAALAAVLVVSFPQWVEFSLWNITTFSSLTILFALRIAVAASLTLIVSLLVGSHFAQKRAEVSSSQFACLSVLTGFGFCVASTTLSLNWSLGVLLAVLATCFVLLAAIATFADSSWPRKYATRIATGACFALVICSTLLTHRYDPRQAAQLLFSTRVFMAYKTDLPRKFLTHLNDARHLSTVEGEFGTLTAWNHQAAQLQVRQNGIPKGIASRDTVVGPQFSAEMMHSILPLVMHRGARDVLVLGYGAGTSMRTTLHFPVQNVTCLEADSGVIKLAQQNWATENGTTILEDKRVETIHADPSIAVASLNQTYDVILNSPDHSALQHAGYSTTKEFYKDVAKKLSNEGLFCQRFSSSDYGEQPVRSLAATLRSVFPHVMMFDVATGELVFMASNNPFTQTSKELLKRADAPQVRSMMSELGWDWSVLMNIALYDEDAVNQLVSSNKQQNIAAAKINSVQSGFMSTVCPLEVIQGEKTWTQPIRKILAEKRTRLLEKITTIEQEQIDEVSARLKDVWARHQIIKDYADAPWAYRKVMKERLTKTPRSKILPVKNEGLKRVMHPDDKIRVQYLEALGKALRANPPSEKDLRDVEEYATPYDPLVSEFLHTELARLNTRMNPPNYKGELRHRMHSINFGSADDRSIRDITRCVEILTKNSDAVPTAEERWDYTNALLTALKQRWEARRRNPSILPEIEKADINLSIKASTSGCELLKTVAKEIGVPSESVDLRCQLLERKLVNRLRTHRSRLNNIKQAEKTRKLNNQLQHKLKQLAKKNEDAKTKTK